MKWWLLLVLGVLCGEYGWSCRVRIWIRDGNSRLYLNAGLASRKPWAGEKLKSIRKKNRWLLLVDVNYKRRSIYITTSLTCEPSCRTEKFSIYNTLGQSGLPKLRARTIAMYLQHLSRISGWSLVHRSVTRVPVNVKTFQLKESLFCELDKEAQDGNVLCTMQEKRFFSGLQCLQIRWTLSSATITRLADCIFCNPETKSTVKTGIYAFLNHKQHTQSAE
jgi:hypothetical protein